MGNVDNPGIFKPLAIAIGLSFSITACGGGGGGSDSSSFLRQLFVQPIQVCDDNGVNCADMQFYEDITDKIWAQAGIDITFLTPNRLNSSTYLSIAPNPDTAFPFTNYEFYQLSFTGGPGAFGRHPDSGTERGPINIWFVDQIESTSGLVLGTAWVGSNGVLISDETFSFNSGLGRIDTIAHEIGHNLGLRHRTFGAGGSNNLMTTGTVRNIPGSIDDITPDGANLDQLTQSQIDEARASGFLEDSDGSSTEDPGVIEPSFDQVSDPPVPALDDWIATSPKPADQELSDHASSDGGYKPPALKTSASFVAPLKFTDLAKPANVSEPLISPLIWLGLAASGLVYRRRQG